MFLGCYIFSVKNFNGLITDCLILCQVIDGGDLDINFMVTSPHGRIMVSELMKSDAVHK